jgi:hypothetical protein
MAISIILPYLSNSKCIDICKKYINQNTINDYEIIEIIDNYDVYAAYNEGVRKAKYDVVFLINDDMFVSPAWDELYIKHTTPRSVVTGMLIESGRIPVNFRNVEFNCGKTPEEFDYDKFLSYIKDNPIDDVKTNSMGWYMPVAFHKSTYIDYPNEIKYPHPNDVTLLSHMLPADGFDFKQVGVYTYHIQNFSKDN